MQVAGIKLDSFLIKTQQFSYSYTVDCYVVTIIIIGSIKYHVQYNIVLVLFLLHCLDQVCTSV